MASSSASKKRKRDVTDDADKVSFQLSNVPVSQLGPVLVSYPSLVPDKKTPFQCYLRSKPRDNEAEEDFALQRTLVAGEANSVEFTSSTESQSASVGCRYLIGVHNKRTNMTVLRPAPLHLLTRQVKALKGIEPAAVSALERLKARAALGETFGTKKAKAAIRAAERNKVDVAAMEGVAGHIQESIEKNTEALPTQDEAKAQADTNRLVPPYNEDAETPGDVYPLHNVIPESEWKALTVSAFSAAQSNKDRIALLPYTRSKWANQHLERLYAASPPNKTNAKILFYITTMLAFRGAVFKMKDKQSVHDRLSGVPSIVVDGLLTRFTETPRGSTKAQTTTQTDTLLFTYMFALMLRLDGFATDTSLVADDLNMTTTKVNQLFKSLGCKVEKPKVNDLKRLGLPDSEGDTKRAMLKVPVVFPKPPTRKRARQ